MVTILIVDDVVENARILASLVQDLGEVVFATDGEAALALSEQHAPDLVLLDATMPGMTGFDVCEAVRADENVRATRILMLTAKGRESDVARGLGAGADAYVTKPFSTRDLVAKVREMLA
ncbi:MAG TPA: response regulator [Gemmatimonadales bacterium]|nr:response regulator [Gemmatimonadales bacterium]